MYRIRYNVGRKVMHTPRVFRKKAVAQKLVTRAIRARRDYRRWAKISNPRVVRR